MTSSLLDFTAIDFETANSDRASVCQVGLAKVQGGIVVATDAWLVIPPTGWDSFSRMNISVHGITPADVQREGISWTESFERLEAFRAGSPLVAHNVGFDRGVYRAASEAMGIEVPSVRWEDTLTIARRHLDLPNCRLTTVAEHFGLGGFHHHDAAADAEVCARIALGIAERIGAIDLDGLWAPRPTERRSQAGRAPTGAAALKAGDLPRPSADGGAAGPLAGHQVVLTGAVPGMDRLAAFEAIAAAGGTPQQGVNRKTTLVVVAGLPRVSADYDPSVGSGKEKKASALIQAGSRIRFIGADDFQEALQGTPAPERGAGLGGV